VTVGTAKDWVTIQTRERYMREMAADEREYEERLTRARKNEAALRKMASARANKKSVRYLNFNTFLI
jgi:chromosome transmission fidelity protein 1